MIACLVLDHFQVSADELLVCKRQLVKEPNGLQVENRRFLKLFLACLVCFVFLQKLTMKQIMLGERLEHSKEELLVVKDVM